MSESWANAGASPHNKHQTASIRSGIGLRPSGPRRERRAAPEHRSSRIANSPMGTRQPSAAAAVHAAAVASEASRTRTVRIIILV